MNHFNVLSILLLGLLISCKPLGINGGYYDLGSFNSRVEAQNKAIADILKNYGSLPTGGYYKLKYSNAKALPTEHRENALWYSKSEFKLILEVDVNSGPACSWQEVDRAVLEQAVKSTNGLAKIDSLSKPNQPIAQCLQ